jgi:hypothetical protein
MPLGADTFLQTDGAFHCICCKGRAAGEGRSGEVEAMHTDIDRVQTRQDRIEARLAMIERRLEER